MFYCYLCQGHTSHRPDCIAWATLASPEDPLTDMVERAEQGEAFRLVRNGRDAAVLIGIAEYERLVGAL